VQGLGFPSVLNPEAYSATCLATLTLGSTAAHPCRGGKDERRGTGWYRGTYPLP